jgi:plasmid maintenance system antidote protein VapI
MARKNPLSEHVTRELRRIGYSRARAAFEADIGASTLDQVCSGRRIPTLPIAVRLDRLFGTDRYRTVERLCDALRTQSSRSPREAGA